MVIVAVYSYHGTLAVVNSPEQNSCVGWGRVAGLQPTSGLPPRAARKWGDVRPWIGCGEWMSSPEALEVHGDAPKFGVLAAWRRERPSRLEEG